MMNIFIIWLNVLSSGAIALGFFLTIVYRHDWDLFVVGAMLSFYTLFIAPIVATLTGGWMIDYFRNHRQNKNEGKVILITIFFAILLQVFAHDLELLWAVLINPDATPPTIGFYHFSVPLFVLGSFLVSAILKSCKDRIKLWAYVIRIFAVLGYIALFTIYYWNVEVWDRYI